MLKNEEISVRVIYLCNHNGIRTMTKLLKLYRKDKLRALGFGKRTLEEVAQLHHLDLRKRAHKLMRLGAPIRFTKDECPECESSELYNSGEIIHLRGCPLNNDEHE